MPDDLTELNADIAQVQNQDAGFGTGRLVAENLILTAAHTLWRKIGADPVLTAGRCASSAIASLMTGPSVVTIR